MAATNTTSSQYRAVYVGNLSPRVNDFMLQDIFQTCGQITSVKIVHEQNSQNMNPSNYGFVEFAEPRSAEMALQTMNGRRIFENEIKVNWAYQGQQKEDTSGHFHVFVGDLSPDINDETLSKAFAQFPSKSDARVMWDTSTGRSRGYGFVAFREKAHAEQAIATMNGEYISSRPIRVNWANQKVQNSQGGQHMPVHQPHHQQQQQQQQQHLFNASGATYEQIINQSAPSNTTVYLGNITPYTTQNDLIPLVQNFGYINEIRMSSDRGFAFVKLDTHENAATCIVNLQGYQVHGRPLKVGWGKDKPADPVMSPQGGHPQQQQAQGNGFYGYGNYGNGYESYMQTYGNAAPYAAQQSNQQQQQVQSPSQQQQQQQPRQ